MVTSEGQVLIDGRWREAAGGSLPVVNPSDGETFAEIARGGPEEVNAAVDAARRALEGDWGRMPAFERGRKEPRVGGHALDVRIGCHDQDRSAPCRGGGREHGLRRSCQARYRSARHTHPEAACGRLEDRAKRQ